MELYEFIKQRILNNVLGRQMHAGRTFINLIQEEEKNHRIID